MFQNKLSEVLFEDSTQLGTAWGIDEVAKEIINSLRFREQKLILEVCSYRFFLGIMLENSAVWQQREVYESSVVRCY